MIKKEARAAMSEMMEKMRVALKDGNVLQRIQAAIAERKGADGAGKNVDTAVDGFLKRINQAVEGNSIARDIQDSVWQFLKELGVKRPHR